MTFLNFFRDLFRCISSCKCQRSSDPSLESKISKEKSKSLKVSSEESNSLSKSQDLLDDEDYFTNIKSQDYTDYLEEILEQETQFLNTLTSTPATLAIEEIIEEDSLEADILTPKFFINDLKFVENGRVKEGGCAYVKEAFLINKGREIKVAVKTYKQSVENCLKGDSVFKNEVSILKSIKHENILAYIGVVEENVPSILTEWCSGPNLLEYMNSKTKECFDLASMYELMDIAWQISKAMEYLHANEVIHRDLKSQNVFLVPKESSSSNKDIREWTAKIGDFGLAISPVLGFNKEIKDFQSKCAGSSYW